MTYSVEVFVQFFDSKGALVVVMYGATVKLLIVILLFPRPQANLKKR